MRGRIFAGDWLVAGSGELGIGRVEIRLRCLVEIEAGRLETVR